MFYAFVKLRNHVEYGMVLTVDFEVLYGTEEGEREREEGGGNEGDASAYDHHRPRPHCHRRPHRLLPRYCFHGVSHEIGHAGLHVGYIKGALPSR
jgi:hypothetical protein